MNMPLNLRALLKHAEASKEAAAWEALARNLLAEKGFTAARAKPSKKPATPKSRGVTQAWLTLTERRALGLPPAKDGKIGAGAYLNVLVEFADGVKMVAGQYPRAKDPLDRTQAIISARARYLRIASGGQYISPKARIPQVVKVTPIAGAELETWRDRCAAIRSALEAFTFAPHWDQGIPRSIAWLRLEALRARAENGPGAPLSASAKLLAAHYAKPIWWRVEYRGEA